MSKDIENLVKSLLNSPKGAQIMNNMDEINKIISSEQGKKMMQSLSDETGNAVKRAAQAAKDGEADLAKTYISKVLATKEGQEIAKKLMDLKK